MLRTLICLLFSASLALFVLPPKAQSAEEVALAAPVQELLDEARRRMADGDGAGARVKFLESVPALRVAGEPEDLIGALAALAQLDAEAGRSRQALDWWLQALSPADAVARADGSENPDLGAFVRVQIAALLRGLGDLDGSERMGWDIVIDAVASNRLATAPVGILTILRTAALEEDAAVRERMVELDELLADFDEYRLHSLPRPLPLVFMSHDVARQYAEAELYEEAHTAFAVTARSYQALDAPDLAARATVDLARAAMERGQLHVAESALGSAMELDPAMAERAGASVVSAELLLRRGRVEAAGRRFLELSRAASDAPLIALYLVRAARLLGVAHPREAIELHGEAARRLREAGAEGEAVVEDVHRVFQLARDAQWRAVGEELLQISRVLGEDTAPRLPSEVTARLAVARARWHASQSEFALARTALADAGGALFRRADTDGVSGVAALYADLALGDGDSSAAEAALANARDMEESLGLRVDGWRSLAALGRVSAAGGDADTAHAAFQEAATRVEWLAHARAVPREAPMLGGPAGEIYTPWLTILLGEGRHDEAFEVLQRWRGWQRARGSRSGDGRASLEQQVTALRDSLKSISTRATKEDHDDLRAPLLDEMTRLRDQMPTQLGCTADSVRVALPKGAGLIDGVALPSGEWVFLVDEAGLEVRPLPASGQLSRRDPLRTRAQRMKSVAHTGLVGWSRAGAPHREVQSACDVGDPWSPLIPSALGNDVLAWVEGDVVEASLLSSVPLAPIPQGVVVVVPSIAAPDMVRELRSRGAGAVVSADVPPERLTELLAAGKQLDRAVQSLLPRRSPSPVIWGPLP